MLEDCLIPSTALLGNDRPGGLLGVGKKRKGRPLPYCISRMQGGDGNKP